MLLTSLVALVAACSPAPTPSPSPTVTVEEAAQAYSDFSASWVGTYNGLLNAEAAAADVDQANVAHYARTLAEAYEAFAQGIRTIEFPTSIAPMVQQELDAVDVLVALARQLENAPSNLSVKTQLQEAIGRVGQRSGAVEAALGLFH